MSTLAQVAARLHAVLDSCARARRGLMAATEPLQQAAQRLTEMLQGSADTDAAQARALMSDAANGTAETYRVVATAESHIRAFLAGLGLDATGHTAANSAPSTQDPIEQVRGELPPAVVRGSGQKTHGRWIGPDGTAQPMISGRDDLSNKVNEALRSLGCPRLPARAADDVELKLAALMREKGQADPRMRNITVVINNRPCKGDLSCDELIPVILPEGYSLTVHAPNYRKRFTGGAKPWWR